MSFGDVNRRNMLNKDPSILQNENKHFKEGLSSLRRNNVNTIILGKLNINSIRNKVDLLPDGIGRNANTNVIYGTKIDDKCP